MNTFISLVLALLLAAGCTRQQEGVEITLHMNAVENGLTPFSGPAGMFQSVSDTAQPSFTLAARMADYHVPGVSMAVITDFETEWASGYGVLKAGEERPVTAASVFQAASTSKFLTAAMVLHYAECGKLDLDADVNTYLTSWQVKENQYTREHPVTLRLLLIHKAGMPATNFGRDEGSSPTLVQVLDGTPPARNRPAVVESAPGAVWNYSNVGYCVIQQVLEDVTGKPFETIAREVIFEPLGMQRSTFVYPLPDRLAAEEAIPHEETGAPGTPSLPPAAVAHGGLLTTPSDLALFMCDLMRSYSGRSGKVLSPEYTRMMFTPQTELDPRMFGVPLSMGLGVLLHGSGDDIAVAHPGGNLPGINCWPIFFPAKGQGCVVMTNAAMGELLAMEVIAAVNRVYQ
ncbi:beta-lactamase family protein [bacterium]|nr:beta-lactamase family protein [bacterium]